MQSTADAQVVFIELVSKLAALNLFASAYTGPSDANLNLQARLDAITQCAFYRPVLMN